MGSVLFTDSQQRKTLSAMRSLGEKKIRSDCCETFRCNLSRFSKYSKRFYLAPSSTDAPDDFLNFLLHYISNKESVVFPMDDGTMKMFIDNRDVLEDKCKFVIPPKKSFYIALKKDLSVKWAQKSGIRCPLSVSSENYEVVLEEVCKMKFPVIIKPVDSSGSRGMKVVQLREDFEQAYKNVNEEYPFPIVQEYINISKKIDICLIYNKQSQLRGCFAQRELRNYPDPIGPSTIQESIIHEKAKTLALKFMDGLDWQGVAELEFVVEMGSNDVIFMEINPRFWASLELAVLSGVDFPYMYYLIATTGDCDEVTEYKIGKRAKWSFPGEALAFFEAKKKFGADPSFFCGKGKAAVDDTLRWNDPMPLLGLLLSSFYYATNRKRRKFVLRR